MNASSEAQTPKNSKKMTQYEFEARTNIYLTIDAFEVVNNEYMESNMDKDAFCKWWLKNRLHSFSKELAHESYKQQGRLEGYKEQYAVVADRNSQLRNELSAAQREARERQLRINELENGNGHLQAIIDGQANTINNQQQRIQELEAKLAKLAELINA